SASTPHPPRRSPPKRPPTSSPDTLRPADPLPRNKTMRITRIVITIYGLLFAVLGVGFWTPPQSPAQRFNIEALNVSGFDTVRADLGGLFLTLSALCLVGLR